MFKRCLTNICLLLSFGLVAMLSQGGCATIFSDGKDVITFNSNVDTTKVFLDNSFVGVTPLTLPVDRKLQRTKVRFSKEGYQTQEMSLSHKFNMSTAAVLDVTGSATTMTPGAVDALSGNLIKYSPTEYHIEMVPDRSGSRDLFHKRLASKRFAAHSFQDIRRDLLTGNGMFLDTLQVMFRVPPAHNRMFEEILQANLDALVIADNGLEFWNRLNKLLKVHPKLAHYDLG